MNTFDPFHHPPGLYLPWWTDWLSVGIPRAQETHSVCLGFADVPVPQHSGGRQGLSYLPPCDTQNPVVTGPPALCSVSSSPGVGQQLLIQKPEWRFRAGDKRHCHVFQSTLTAIKLMLQLGPHWTLSDRLQLSKNLGE